MVAAPSYTQPETASWRRWLFLVVAALVALFELVNIGNALAPWLGSPPLFDELQYPESHLWHAAVPGAVRGILMLGVVIALLRKPQEKPLLVQWIALSLIVGLPLIVPFGGVPPLLYIGIPAALVVATYPWPRALLNFSSTAGASRIMLALTLVATVLLIPGLWREFTYQLSGIGGEHATDFHWAGDVQNVAILLLGGFAASTRRAGWRTLSLLTGIVFAYLGVVAIAFPDQAGSWGVLGGVLALIGIAFVILARGEPGNQ